MPSHLPRSVRESPWVLKHFFLEQKDALVSNSQEPVHNPLAGRMSRRRAVGTLAVSGLATGLSATLPHDMLAQNETPSSQITGPDGTTPFNFRLGASEPKAFPAGHARTATVGEMSVLSGLSINTVEIDVGSVRELHWHPNASEINYCLGGQGTIGILSTSGDPATFPITAGSITFVPVGDAHYIRNTGSEPLQLLIGFSHEHPEHLDFSQVMPWVPTAFIGQTLGVAPGLLPNFPPRGDGTIVPVENMNASDRGVQSLVTPFSTHIDTLRVQQFGGGSVQPLRLDDIARLEGITLLKLNIDEGALREPHWHGNASELNYCVSGRAQVGIVGPTGESWTFVVEPGDVGYIPNNWFHYIASVSDEPLVLLAFFDNIAPSRIDLSTLTGYFPAEVLAASLEVDPEIFASLSKGKTMVIAPALSSGGAPEGTPAATPST